MLLHLNFCIEWFDSNSKEKFKTYLKFLGKNWKKKKCFPFIFGFQPVGLAAPASFPASSWAARLSRVEVNAACFPHPLWAEPPQAQRARRRPPACR
jgi:hypothetical protein